MPYRDTSTRDEAAAVRCLYCGARNEPGTPACGRCRVDLRGTSARVAPSKTSGMACPRCKSTYLAPTVVEPGIQMQECAGCRGIFISPSAWSTMFDLVEAGEPIGVGRFVPLKPGAAAPALLDLVHCPSCNGEMDRAAFAARSRIIIDICSAHGVWLDAAELAPIVLHFQRLGRGEIEEEPSSVRGPEAQSLLAEIAAAERDFDLHYGMWKDAEQNQRGGWGWGQLGDDVKIAHRHLRELRNRLAAIRAVERAALKAKDDAPE